MSSTSSPAPPPPFSYAQAARGLQAGAASSQKSIEVSATTSDKGARGRQPSSNASEKLDGQPKSSEVDPVAAAPPGVKSAETVQTSSAGSKDLAEKSGERASKRSESREENKTTMSPTIASLSESEPSGFHKDEDISLGLTGASDAWERQSEASTSVERANIANEKDKSQTGDDDWEKVSVPSLSQERELKAAPPPTVNIWQQRKQAQEAKQREQASQRPASSGGKVATPSGPITELNKTKPVEKVASVQERDIGPRRKPTDTSRTTTEKSGQSQPAHGRPSPKGQQNAQGLPPPPPVGDAVAWPTPETTIETEERRKPSLEVNERTEVKQSTKQQKKWTQVPFVPTAVFNTPLPPAAAKRGGRGGNRGGRDGTGRGGHLAQNSISGDKSEPVGSMGPPPVPRQGDQDRGRRPDATRGGRASSVPSQGRRATSTAGTQTESRKVSGGSHLPDGPVSSEDIAGANAQDSRSSSRPTDVSSRAIVIENVDATDPSVVSGNNHAHPEIDPVSRASIPSEWYSSKPTTSSTRPTGEQNAKERSQPRTRTVQESRDKVESWRDREPQADINTRRELRADRGGRGVYRGRGNNSGYMPASTHAYTAPLPQQPFAPHKSHSYNDSRQRQSSQPQMVQPAPSGRGHSVRSQSIPMQQQMPNGMSPLSPIQTDVGMFGYYPQHVNPGPFISPVPHHPALDMYGLMALVSAQLEYYFSIDNLCRDVYLRKHMDSQGFVSLRVIGNFKRITTLTADMELVRVSAAQSKVIELRQGDDGEDRLRRRDGWKQWVFANMEERDPAARNAGPSAQSYQPRRSNYGPLAESPYSIGGPMRSPSWGQPSYNEISGVMSPGLPQQGYPHEHGMSEHAMPFHPPVSDALNSNGEPIQPTAHQAHSRSSSFVHAGNGATANSMTNGHTETGQPQDVPGSDQENVFPNEKVSSIWVYARKGDDDAPSFLAHTSRTFSQGSQGGMNVSANGLSSPTFVSGLRGGAASPEQIQRFHSRDQLPIDEVTQQNGTFFLKDGVSQSDFDREGSDPWPYQVLHAKAVDQRDQGLHGPNNHEMEILYQFWPTFLRQNFNATMYKDFYRFALEDLSHGSSNGSTHLAKYYGYQLSADKPLSDQVAHDIVAAISQENGEARPVFQKVRAFWRDGAFNFKSRKRIDNLLDADLREELDK